MLLCRFVCLTARAGGRASAKPFRGAGLSPRRRGRSGSSDGELNRGTALDKPPFELPQEDQDPEPLSGAELCAPPTPPQLGQVIASPLAWPGVSVPETNLYDDESRY